MLADLAGSTDLQLSRDGVNLIGETFEDKAKAGQRLGADIRDSRDVP